MGSQHYSDSPQEVYNAACGFGFERLVYRGSCSHENCPTRGKSWVCYCRVAGSDVSHVPHLLVTGPWVAARLDVTPEQSRHLTTVLRRDLGSAVAYTDGSGLIGEGTWTGVDIERGEELFTPEPLASLTLAVAPPDSKERVRWLIEKSTELGVGRIRWIRTQFGQGRLPRQDKAQAWMKSALEQSRRARVTVIDSDWSGLGELGDFVAADQAGGQFRSARSVTVAIGPEGGWAQTELPAGTPLVSLGDSVLRSETAAIAAAAVFQANLIEELNQ